MKIRVVVLRNVQYDGRGLKDDMIVALMVNNDGDASVGIELEKPRFLWQDLQGRRKNHESTHLLYPLGKINIDWSNHQESVHHQSVFSANLTRR